MTEFLAKAYSKDVVSIPGHSCLQQHSSRVIIGLRNLTCKPVTIKAKTAVTGITEAKVVPPILAQRW